MAFPAIPAAITGARGLMAARRAGQLMTAASAANPIPPSLAAAGLSAGAIFGPISLLNQDPQELGALIAQTNLSLQEGIQQITASAKDVVSLPAEFLDQVKSGYEAEIMRRSSREAAEQQNPLGARSGRQVMQEGGDVSMLPNVAPAPMMEGTPMGGNLSAPMAPAQAELSPAEMQEAQGALMQIIQIIQMLVNQGMSEEKIQQFLAQYGITEEELDQAAAILGVDIDALMAGEQRMPMAEGGPSKAETIPRDAMDAANAAIGFRLFQDDDGSSKIYSPEQLENVIKVFYDQYEFQLNKGNQAAAKVLSDQINKLEALKIQMQAPQEPMMMAAGGPSVNYMDIYNTYKDMDFTSIDDIAKPGTPEDYDSKMFKLARAIMISDFDYKKDLEAGRNDSAAERLVFINNMKKELQMLKNEYDNLFNPKSKKQNMMPPIMMAEGGPAKNVSDRTQAEQNTYSSFRFAVLNPDGAGADIMKKLYLEAFGPEIYAMDEANILAGNEPNEFLQRGIEMFGKYRNTPITVAPSVMSNLPDNISMTQQPRPQQMKSMSDNEPMMQARSRDGQIFTLKSQITNLMNDYNIAIRDQDFDTAQAIADQINNIDVVITQLQSQMPMGLGQKKN